MDAWSALAEARIRDWQNRVATGEAKAAPPLQLESMEGQLFKEILRLRLLAHERKSERASLLRKADDLRIQLMMLLETDRPLLAQMLNARLAGMSRPPEADE